MSKSRVDQIDHHLYENLFTVRRRGGHRRENMLHILAVRKDYAISPRSVLHLPPQPPPAATVVFAGVGPSNKLLFLFRPLALGGLFCGLFIG